MGDEHDSWLAGIGIDVNASQANNSVLGGLGEMVHSGLDAAGHLAKAGLDIAEGEINTARGGVEHVVAGGLDAVGAHGAAKTVRDDANAAQARGAADFKAAGSELGQAKDDVFGGGTTAPKVPKAKGGSSGGGSSGGSASGGKRAMQPDCKIVRGKVPGPANHVLCATHGHVVDLGSKTVIADSLDQYKKMYAKGGGGGGGGAYKGGGGGGGGGGYGGQGTQPSGKQKGGMRSSDVPEYGDTEIENAYGVDMAERPSQPPAYGGDQDEGYGGDSPQQPNEDYGGGEAPEQPSYGGKKGGKKGGYQKPQQPEQPEYREEGGDDEGGYQQEPQGGYGKGGGQPMRKDCKPVHGKCPGPANHVLCAAHGHVLDTNTGMIIAASVADYTARYCGGGKGGGGGQGGYSKGGGYSGGGGYAPQKPKTGYGGGGGGYSPPKGGGYPPSKPPKGGYGGGGGGGGYGGVGGDYGGGDYDYGKGKGGYDEGGSTPARPEYETSGKPPSNQDGEQISGVSETQED